MTTRHPVLFAVLLALAGPGVAHAATAAVSGGVLTYAAGSEANSLSLSAGNPGVVVIYDQGAPVIVPGTSCMSLSATPPVVQCTGVTSLVARLGAGNDTIVANSLPINETLSGEDGADTLYDGRGNDTLQGGDGDDVLRLQGNVSGAGSGAATGDDIADGGNGVDTAQYDRSAAFPVKVSIDDVANDGSAGEHDNVLTSTENVLGSAGADTLTGSSGPNELTGGGGDDVIDGGAGPDALSGGAGNDTISARDGFADALLCGAGTDNASVDPSDSAPTTGAEACETVDVQTPPTTPTATPTASSSPAGTVTPAADPPSTPTPVPGPASQIVVATAPVKSTRVRRSRTFRLVIANASAFDVSVTARVRLAKGSHATLAVVRFTLASGATAKPRFRFSRHGRLALRALRRRAVPVTIRYKLAGGGMTSGFTQNVVLKRPAV